MRKLELAPEECAADAGELRDGVDLIGLRRRGESGRGQAGGNKLVLPGG